MCAFLALLVILGMFQVHGWSWTGCAGDPRHYRPWVLVRRTGLLWASWVLVFCREKRPTGRLWCLGLLPVVGGAFLHVVLGPPIPPWWCPNCGGKDSKAWAAA